MSNSNYNSSIKKLVTLLQVANKCKTIRDTLMSIADDIKEVRRLDGMVGIDVMLFVNGTISDAGSETVELNKIEKKQIEQYDSLLMVVRIILPVGLLLTVMTILVGVNVFSEQTWFWILEILNVLVALN